MVLSVSTIDMLARSAYQTIQIAHNKHQCHWNTHTPATGDSAAWAKIAGHDAPKHPLSVKSASQSTPDVSVLAQSCPATPDHHDRLAPRSTSSRLQREIGRAASSRGHSRLQHGRGHHPATCAVTRKRLRGTRRVAAPPSPWSRTRRYRGSGKGLKKPDYKAVCGHIYCTLMQMCDTSVSY